MEKTRVLRGDPYWYIELEESIGFRTDFTYDTFSLSDDKNYEIGNYFHTRKETEEMIKKIEAVLNGADAIYTNLI